MKNIRTNASQPSTSGELAVAVLSLWALVDGVEDNEECEMPPIVTLFMALVYRILEDDKDTEGQIIAADLKDCIDSLLEELRGETRQ